MSNVTHVARKVEQPSAAVGVPLFRLSPPRAVFVSHAVLQSGVVEPESVGVLVRAALVAQNLVQDASNYRVVQEDLRRPLRRAKHGDVLVVSS